MTNPPVPPGGEPPEEQPGQQPPSYPQPQPGQPQPWPYQPASTGVQSGALIGGLALGFFLGLVYVFIAFFVGISLSDSSGGGSTALLLLPYAVPFLIAVPLLMIEKTRHAGAGFVMGIAIGAIVLPGVCVVILAGLGTS